MLAVKGVRVRGGKEGEVARAKQRERLKLSTRCNEHVMQALLRLH